MSFFVDVYRTRKYNSIKMDFKCYVCFENFPNCNATIYHLREIHNIKDGAGQTIQCIVNGLPLCQKTYKTIGGLRKHVQKCWFSKKKVMYFGGQFCFHFLRETLTISSFRLTVRALNQ